MKALVWSPNDHLRTHKHVIDKILLNSWKRRLQPWRRCAVQNLLPHCLINSSRVCTCMFWNQLITSTTWSVFCLWLPFWSSSSPSCFSAKRIQESTSVIVRNDEFHQHRPSSDNCVRCFCLCWLWIVKFDTFRFA